jgi:hypothetical protein
MRHVDLWFRGSSNGYFPNNREQHMSTDSKPKGPASYFPSIEKTYGQPVTHWLGLLAKRSGLKHMELVSFLKSEHGLGHGHANALVAHHLATQR